ncbi:WD40 repeat-like protein [Armillaria solidipes]|uniref:WD40 repeat-like protein n=1 Tax=Armillaria solidipes TaxID=1076256 RepID=A0A2H3B645_9AGAR|nr:WD40 repeat-like protein [Armillaria solidipes]
MTTPSTPRRGSVYHPRPSSPSPSTSGFSFIGEDEASSDNDHLYWEYSRSPYKSIGSFGRRAIHSSPALTSHFHSSSSSPFISGSDVPSNSSFKSLLPRLWDVLIASPTKTILSPSRPALSGSGRHAKFVSYSTTSFGRSKGKRMYRDQDYYNDSINFLDLPPLDGDEGELIDVDDEACFIAVEHPWGAINASRARVVTGIDILSLLPPELSLQVLSMLAFIPSCLPSASLQDLYPSHEDGLHAIITCLAVSQTWRRLANDNSVWRAFFISRWGNLECPDKSLERKNLQHANHRTRRTHTASGSINYRYLYQERLELERRWGAVSRQSLSNHLPWEPKITKLTGHSDSVYCLELCRTASGQQHIITGSRDRTIKMWSLKTGRCLGTFGGNTGDVDGHRGSVLCLKFFWENDGRNGVLYSGSSDCTVCVWDVWIVKPGRSRHFDDSDEGIEVQARIKTVLRGHNGGVLDLRVDANWIVSCSKDTVIRVWRRDTLELYRTLRGHEGPVNAVCLEGGKLVSASGDGKMILWDIARGERLRTLEGHDRGLACIEFKDDLIISGSNDCRIKIWSATSGECLTTLVGHDALVRALAFDPRSGRLVSASYDKSVRVWDVATGKMLREFKQSHTSHIFDVKFDVSRIVSTSHDQRIVVLDFSEGLDGAELFM